jgi:hypothetical protein
MHSLPDILSSVPLHWWVALIISVLGIAAICIRAFETEEARVRRAERNKKKELRSMAQRIRRMDTPFTNGTLWIFKLTLHRFQPQFDNGCAEA